MYETDSGPNEIVYDTDPCSNEIVYETDPCPNEIVYETDPGLAPGKLVHQSDPETSKQSLSAYSPIMKRDKERKIGIKRDKLGERDREKEGLRETNSKKEIERRRE